MRVSDASASSDLAARIGVQRSRLNILQERLASNKRINRPSDDPTGADAVLRLRTSQTEIEGFKRSAKTANQRLTAADDALQSYEPIIERVRGLVTQGLTDTTTQDAKNALATELDSLRSRILNVANAKNGDEYLFGGTRQNAPPFDPTTGVPAATPTNPQYVQIEPGANAIATGVTAETVFADANSTIFADLTAAAQALRETGNPVADRATLQNTNSRLIVYTGLANVVHAKVGAGLNTTESAQDKLSADFLSLNERASSIEDADFAATALDLNQTERSLDATLQVAGRQHRSLIDFLG